MATHGLNCTAYQQRPTLISRAAYIRRRIFRAWHNRSTAWPALQRAGAWAVLAWCTFGWILVIPAWLYLRGAA